MVVGVKQERGILHGPEEPWKPGIKATCQDCVGIVPTVQYGTFKPRGFPVGALVFHPGLCAPTTIGFSHILHNKAY